MRAARWYGRMDVRIEDVEEPRPSSSQAIVKVEWCGICGTDLKEYTSGPIDIAAEFPHPLTGRKAPLTLGHEAVGVVVAAAPDGSGPAEGQRVIPDVVMGCGACWWCQRHQEGLCERQAVVGLHTDGGLAEYMLTEAATSVPVPEGLPPEVAVLAEPTSVAVRAVKKIPQPLGASVLVNGAGTIGLLVTQVALATGVQVLVAVDPDPARRAKALALGAHAALEPEEVPAMLPDLTQGRGPDVVMETSGVPGRASFAVKTVRRGGTAIVVGLHDQPEALDVLNMVLGEKHVRGTAAHLWDEDVSVAVELLALGRIRHRELISERIKLENLVDEGFGALMDQGRDVMKVIVEP